MAYRQDDASSTAASKSYVQQISNGALDCPSQFRSPYRQYDQHLALTES